MATGRLIQAAAILLGVSACEIRAGTPETVTLHYWGGDSDVLALDLIQEFERLHD